MKVTITNTFEVEAIVSVKSQIFDPDPEDVEDWEIEFEADIVCLETGCIVDDSVILNNDEARLQIIKYYWDNYEPPGI